MSDTYLKIPEIASYLGKSEQTIRRLIKTGEIPTDKIRTPQGYQYLAKIQDLQKLLKGPSKNTEIKKATTQVSLLKSDTKHQEFQITSYVSPPETWESYKEIEEMFIGQDSHHFYPSIEQAEAPLEKPAPLGQPEHFFIKSPINEIHWYLCSPAYMKTRWTLDFEKELF